MTTRAYVSFAAFSDELRKIAAEKPTKADALVYRALAKGAPVKIRIDEEATQHGGGFFDFGKKEIVLSQKRYEVLAHEVGHAHVDHGILGKLLQNRVALTAFNLAGGALAGIGVGILMAKGKKWGLLLPAAAAAPTILSEILATRKGRELLEKARAGPKQKETYEKSMKEGLSSYLARPVIGTAVGGLIGALASSGAFTPK